MLSDTLFDAVDAMKEAVSEIEKYQWEDDSYDSIGTEITVVKMAMKSTIAVMDELNVRINEPYLIQEWRKKHRHCDGSANRNVTDVNKQLTTQQEQGGDVA